MSGGRNSVDWSGFRSVVRLWDYVEARNAGRPVYTERNSFYRTYVIHILDFTRFLGYDDPDELIGDAKAGKLDVVEAIVDYIRHLVKRGRSPNYIRKAVMVVKRWFIINGVKFDWEEVRSLQPLPIARPLTEDRIPTKEELRRILSYVNPKMKALLLIMLSSGIRLGSLINLKLKHIDLESYPDIGIIKVPPEYSKTSTGYYTLINDEAREALEYYLNLRRRRGERLTPESWLFPSNKNPDKPLTHNSVREVYRYALKKLGLYKKDKKTHLSEIHLHTLRKYFRTMMERGLTRSEIERLMGHRGGGGATYLDGAYFRPPEEELIMKYRAEMHRLYVFKESENEREQLKRQILLMAKIYGATEEELKQIDEILHRSRTLDEAIEEIRKYIPLARFKTNGASRDIVIVKTEEELINKLNEGYEIIRELKNGRIVLKRYKPSIF